MKNKIKIAIKHLKVGTIHQPHIDMAIEALKKQIPTKPIMQNWAPALCPCCGAELSESLGDGYYRHWQSMKVCDCGQKLTWKDEDEDED